MFRRLKEPAEFELVTVILSLVFVGMGLLFTYFIGRQTTLECSRVNSEQSCHMQTTWMNLVHLNDRQVNEVKSATVEESCDDEGCTYRVRIRTDKGPLLLGEVYSSGLSDKETVAEQINAFAAGQIDTLNVSDGGGFWIVIPLIFVAVGIGIILRPLAYRLFQIFAPEEVR